MINQASMSNIDAAKFAIFSVLLVCEKPIKLHAVVKWWPTFYKESYCGIKQLFFQHTLQRWIEIASVLPWSELLREGQRCRCRLTAVDEVSVDRRQVLRCLCLWHSEQLELEKTHNDKLTTSNHRNFVDGWMKWFCPGNYCCCCCKLTHKIDILQLGEWRLFGALYYPITYLWRHGVIYTCPKRKRDDRLSTIWIFN